MEGQSNALVKRRQIALRNGTFFLRVHRISLLLLRNRPTMPKSDINVPKT
jgi:hypothetical protein